MRQEDEKRAEIVRKAIKAFEDKLDGNGIEPTIADFIRLLQLERELEPEQAREVTVKWVDTE